VRSEQPSPLTDEERALIDGFLQHDFAGVPELREQASHMTARRGCECGCGTIELVPDGTSVPRSQAANPVPIDATVCDPNGAEVGGLILFVRDGMMQSLEIYSHTDPLPFPDPQDVTWRA
jgi:hypothetical protein